MQILDMWDLLGERREIVEMRCKQSKAANL